VLRAELERLAELPLAELDAGDVDALYCDHALTLSRFRPPRWDTDPTFFTVEGDPIGFATATWEVRDHAAVAATLRELGGLRPGDPVEIDITASRASLSEDRPELPLGAQLIETTVVGAPDTISIATIRLEGNHLHAEAMSEERIARAIDAVEIDLGALVEFRGWDITSVDDALAERRGGRSGARMTSRKRVPRAEREIVGEFATARMRSWIGEPHPALDGRTPRQALSGPARADVVRLVRQLENIAERARRNGEPAPDIAQIRRDLALDDLAA